jgi:hypothetical protein
MTTLPLLEEDQNMSDQGRQTCYKWNVISLDPSLLPLTLANLGNGKGNRLETQIMAMMILIWNYGENSRKYYTFIKRMAQFLMDSACVKSVVQVCFCWTLVCGNHWQSASLVTHFHDSIYVNSVVQACFCWNLVSDNRWHSATLLTMIECMWAVCCRYISVEP